MHIESLTVGPLQSNCHIVYNDEGEALVFDPGDDADRILQFIGSRALTVRAYPLTHGHVDHVSAVAAVYDRIPAPVGIHPADRTWAFTEHNQVPPFYGPPQAPPEFARSYEEGQTWQDAGFTYRVLHTPGHSPGSVSFYFEEEAVLISGDVLFQGSVGRSDLPGGSAATLTASLKRLAVLPPETRVYSGHGPETTIGAELATNFFLRGFTNRSTA